MWDITKDAEYQKAIAREFAKRWARQANREEDARSYMACRHNGLYTLDDLVKVCFDKAKGLPEIKAILTRNSTKATEGVECYVNQVLKRWDDKPERYLDAVNHNERPQAFDASLFSGKSYEFLNALFACFPEAVLDCPGLMAGEWKDKAFLPENLARTTIGLGAGYQTLFVHKTRSQLSLDQDMDAFAHKFQATFGVHPSKIPMLMPIMDAEQSKTVLRYFKKSVALTNQRDNSIMNWMRYYGYAPTGWIVRVFGKAGVFANEDVCEKILRHLGNDPARSVLAHYIVNGFAPLDKLGRMFSQEHVNQKIIERLIDAEGDHPGEDFVTFLKGFTKAEKEIIFKRENFPVEYLEDRELRRRAVSSELGL